MDFILDTVAVAYPLDPMLTALKLAGTLCSVACPTSSTCSPVFPENGVVVDTLQ